MRRTTRSARRSRCSSWARCRSSSPCTCTCRRARSSSTVPEAVRKAGAFAGALCLVLGLIAVAAFLLALGGGDVSARGAIALVLGIAAIAIVPRLVSVPALLGGYSALVYVFLFFPIVVVVVFAFNSGTNVA